MKKSEIQVGGLYKARVSSKITTVKVDAIRSMDTYVRGPGHRAGTGGKPGTRDVYDVTNLSTGRKTTFRSAQKFIAPVDPAPVADTGRPESLPPTSPEVHAASSVPYHVEKARNGFAAKLAARSTAIPSAPPVIVSALAGTGKTTTLVEGLKLLLGEETTITPSEQQRAVWDAICLSRPEAGSGVRPYIAFVAFNKSIAAELERRVPAGCDAMTMHRMGNKAVTATFGRVELNKDRVQNIIAHLLGKDIRDLRREQFELVKATESLVKLCKMNLVDDANPFYGRCEDPREGGWEEARFTGESWWSAQLDKLASHYDIELNGSREKVYDLVPQVLTLCKDVKGFIDYNDMIWLPIALNLQMPRYDLLLVDEAQDLNRCQQALAKKAGKRLILCGDVHQAIYGFAGADSESMNRMAEELNDGAECITLPLTVTRRCGKAIVAEARRIVPAFEAHESNPDGKVLNARFGAKSQEPGKAPVGELAIQPGATYHTMVADSDMLICRVNAPLVSQCFRFLKAGRKAEIQGRDMGQGLISTINKQKAKDVPDLVGKLSDWIHAEQEKENRKRIPDDDRLIALQDRYDCLLAFTEGAQTIAAVIQKINETFTTGLICPKCKQKAENEDFPTCYRCKVAYVPSPGIKLSTIHKAKGLEAHRVFLLEPEGATVPHPMAKSAWQREQEMNLRYVAITRAIEELVYVK